MAAEKKTVIGLVGEKGSGKGTFGTILKEILPQKTISRIRFSDVLTDTLSLWGIPQTRSNLQTLAVIMKNQYGPALSHAVYIRILRNTSDIVLLDGIRWQPDVDLLRSMPSNLLVYITAPTRIRYERTRERAEKPEESTMQYEQFLKEETSENEILIAKIGTTADFKINNTGTLEQFKKEVVKIASKFLPSEPSLTS